MGYGHEPWNPADVDFKPLSDWGAYAEMIWKAFVTDDKVSIHRVDIVEAPPGK